MSDVKVTIPRDDYNPNQRTNIDVEVVNPDGSVSTKTVKGAVQSTTQEDGSVSFGILASAHVPFAAGSFVPTDISGCSLWLDATNSGSITESSGAVSAWDDLSGSGHSLVQSTAGAKPTTGTRTHNSLNVLDFDGGDYLFDSTAGISTAAFTVFAVCAGDATQNFVGIVSATPASGSDNNSANGFALSAGYQDRSVYAALDGNHSGSAAEVGLRSSSSSPFTAVQTGVGVYHARGNASALRVWKDGAVGFDSGSRGSTGTSSGVLVGARFLSGAASTAYAFNGWIGEVVIYNSQLSAADMNTVGEYLQAKWGTASWNTIVTN